jgi:hypothetical protein
MQIMDRLMVSDANLSYSRECGFSYIAGLLKAQLVHLKAKPKRVAGSLWGMGRNETDSQRAGERNPCFGAE